MQLVVLDGYTLNPGDLAWDPLHALGDCTIYDRTPPAEVVARAGGAETIDEAGEAGASGRSTRLTVRHRGVDAAIICRN